MTMALPDRRRRPRAENSAQPPTSTPISALCSNRICSKARRIQAPTGALCTHGVHQVRRRDPTLQPDRLLFGRPGHVRGLSLFIEERRLSQRSDGTHNGGRVLGLDAGDRLFRNPTRQRAEPPDPPPDKTVCPCYFVVNTDNYSMRNLTEPTLLLRWFYAARSRAASHIGLRTILARLGVNAALRVPGRDRLLVVCHRRRAARARRDWCGTARRAGSHARQQHQHGQQHEFHANPFSPRPSFDGVSPLISLLDALRTHFHANVCSWVTSRFLGRRLPGRRVGSGDQCAQHQAEVARSRRRRRRVPSVIECTALASL